MIDAMPLLLRGAGIKSYLYYWLRALHETRGGNRLSRFPHIGEIGPFGTERTVASNWATGTSLLLFYLSASRVGMPFRYLLTHDVDIFHISSHLRRPPPSPKLTATIYDLTCWLMPELHTPKNVEATRAFGEHIWRKADRLIAISHSAKADAVRILGLRPEKIDVIYPGVAPHFFDVSDEEINRIRIKYNLVHRYIVFLGTIEPRKNIARLLDAWMQVPRSLREDAELIIVGPFGWESPRLRTRLEANSERTRYLGPLPEEALPGLIAGALALIFPSLYEGFGLPVAQAMAAGVPVLTSNGSSLIEISEGCGLHFDARSEAEISSCLEDVLTSGDHHKPLGDKGRARAEEFRWSENAHQSWRFFESI